MGKGRKRDNIPARKTPVPVLMIHGANDGAQYT